MLLLILVTILPRTTSIMRGKRRTSKRMMMFVMAVKLTAIWMMVDHVANSDVDDYHEEGDEYCEVWLLYMLLTVTAADDDDDDAAAPWRPRRRQWQRRR